LSTFDDLRKIALSLPLSYEDLHFAGPAFRVDKRKFALRWRETGQTIRKEMNTLVTEACSTVVSKTVAREYLSALGPDGRLADDWRFLCPALATESPARRVRR
jgi:hypothetical protein